MKKIITGLLVVMCLAFLGYAYMRNTSNSQKSVHTPSRLENCQNLKINDPKLIAFANKCLIEDGERISDFAPPEIKRYSKSDIQKFYKSRNEKFPEIQFPDEWTVWYNDKRGAIGGDYLVKISPVTCECTVSGLP